MTQDPKEPNWLGLEDPITEEDAHQAVRENPELYIAEWLVQGDSVADVVEKLLMVGFPMEDANVMVADIRTNYATELGTERRRRGRQKALTGVIVFALGGAALGANIAFINIGVIFLLPAALIIGGVYFFVKGVSESLSD